MKATRFYNKLMKLFDTLNEGYVASIEINNLGGLIRRDKEITPSLIKEMLQSPISEDFFDNPFYFPFDQVMLNKVIENCYITPESYLSNWGVVLDKDKACSYEVEQNLILLVTKIYEKQEKLKEDFIPYFNKILESRLQKLDEALQLVENKIDSLEKRQGKRGFFDTESNIQAKLNRLRPLKMVLQTVQSEIQKIQSEPNRLNIEDQEQDSSAQEKLFQQITNELVEKSDVFLRESETKLEMAFSSASSYMSIEEQREGRHSNPLMKFLDKVYHIITGGNVLTDTESVIKTVKSITNF